MVDAAIKLALQLRLAVKEYQIGFSLF